MKRRIKTVLGNPHQSQEKKQITLVLEVIQMKLAQTGLVYDRMPTEIQLLRLRRIREVASAHIAMASTS